MGTDIPCFSEGLSGLGSNAKTRKDCLDSAVTLGLGSNARIQKDSLSEGLSGLGSNARTRKDWLSEGLSGLGSNAWTRKDSAISIVTTDIKLIFM